MLCGAPTMGPTPQPERAAPLSRDDLVVVLGLLVASLLYALVVVKDFSGPLVGVDDTNALEHLGFMMEQKLVVGVPPALRLVATREMLYPFGTLVVFLPWGVERDLLYVLAHGHVGEGPWLQLYQAASVVLSSVGTYALLRREEAATRAGLVAFVGTFMNFYAVYKFPHHMNVSTMHWAVLSVVLDFVIFRRLVRREPLGVRHLLAKTAFLLLCFGLDLGYVMGFALLSTAVTGLVALVVAFRRERTASGTLRAFTPRNAAAELRARPLLLSALSALLLLALLVYLPIVLDIVRATRTYTFQGPGGSFWASQLRIFFPYLPFVAPPSAFVGKLFGQAEGIGEFSVGWALLATLYLGVRGAKKRGELLLLVPIAIAFVLCFTYHPRRLPTLRLFPWFQYNRVAGRATLFFPLWIALVALSFRAEDLASRARRVLGAVGVLGAIEIVTAYASFEYAPFRTDASFWRYMEEVKSAPGEAVLDWPFCISGGNGVATNDLCPYYALTSTTYAYRRFHRKNVVGLLLSRMTEAQAKPFYDLRLPRLFSPDSPEIRTARKQTRCFDSTDWEIFDGFYRAHAFAGVSLYPDLLPAGCEQAFVERYGAPVAETFLPAEGRALFFRRRHETPPP